MDPKRWPRDQDDTYATLRDLVTEELRDVLGAHRYMYQDAELRRIAVRVLAAIGIRAPGPWEK
jgi:hypothetical protein